MAMHDFIFGPNNPRPGKSPVLYRYRLQVWRDGAWVVLAHSKSRADLDGYPFAGAVVVDRDAVRAVA